MKEKEEVRFGDLSIWLKIPIVIMWVMGVLWCAAFITGFIIGVIGGV